MVACFIMGKRPLFIGDIPLTKTGLPNQNLVRAALKSMGWSVRIGTKNSTHVLRWIGNEHEEDLIKAKVGLKFNHAVYSAKWLDIEKLK